MEAVVELRIELPGFESELDLVVEEFKEIMKSGIVNDEEQLFQGPKEALGKWLYS